MFFIFYYFLYYLLFYSVIFCLGSKQFHCQLLKILHYSWQGFQTSHSHLLTAHYEYFFNKQHALAVVRSTATLLLQDLIYAFVIARRINFRNPEGVAGFRKIFYSHADTLRWPSYNGKEGSIKYLPL